MLVFFLSLFLVINLIFFDKFFRRGTIYRARIQIFVLFFCTVTLVHCYIVTREAQAAYNPQWTAKNVNETVSGSWTFSSLLTLSNALQVTGTVTTAGGFYGNGTGITGITATNATNATNLAITNDVATSSTVNLVWVGGTSGNQAAKVSAAGLVYIPSTGRLGIGYSLPGAALAVNGHIGAGTSVPGYDITAYSDSNDVGMVSQAHSDSKAAYFSTYNNGAGSGNYTQFRSYGGTNENILFGLSTNKMNSVWSAGDSVFTIGTMGATPL
ncbi:MAG: hypothetical protein HQL25_07720, partial [Candidatus Omnitrophica bacterium]|nr:hypothetical protein [Candidatus Omnitrophota bacterium]